MLTFAQTDWIERSRVSPYKHQVVGVEKLVTNPFFLLADDMGAGKTKQAIDAAQLLFVQGAINRVVVFAPAAVRSVWFGKLGQLVAHLWTGLASTVSEFHARIRTWRHPGDGPELEWWVTNYEFIRSKNRLAQLLTVCGPKTLLILDESSLVKNHKAEQTKAVLQVRRKCGRVWLLNGTPIANSPLDMFSQGNIMHPSILDCKYVTYFKARYAKQQAIELKNGRIVHTVTEWINLDDLQRRFAPYVLRRLKEDCLDLPPKLPPVTLEATLTPETWKLYKQMRDEMVVWLQNSVWTASQVIVQSLRLAQITSGFIGGQRETLEGIEDGQPIPEWMGGTPALPFEAPTDTLRWLGSEKLDVYLDWLELRLDADPNFKLLTWFHFRPELERVAEAIAKRFPKVEAGLIWGSQKRAQRDAAVALLDPRTMPTGPVAVLGTAQTGGMGLSLVGASSVFYFSNDYNLKTRLQSEDRVHRPGQLHPVSYFDLVAVGPKGQKTINHAILQSLREKDDIANWTTSKWVQTLTSDD